MEQLEGMIGTLRVYTSRLATKESYWIFHRDGDDFDLKVSDPKNPSYLLIANDPEMESIIGALNALILNRLVTRVNTGQGKNIPESRALHSPYCFAPYLSDGLFCESKVSVTRPL